MKGGLRQTENRIGILTPTLAGGGAERKALSIASGLLERGYEVDLLLHRLICHYPGEVPAGARLFFQSNGSDERTRPYLGRLSAVSRPLVPAPVPWSVRFPRVALVSRLRRMQWPLLVGTRPPRWAACIATYVDRERPAALLAMNVVAVAATTMASALASRSPRIVGTLHDVFRSRRLMRRARMSYPYADAAVGVSHGVAAQLNEFAEMSPERIHTIYNPVVSDSLLRRACDPVDHPWLEESTIPVVVSAGRLKAVKDFSTLLRAFGQLLSWRDARLIVLGEGPLRRNLESMAHQLRIAERVDFPGFVDNPYAYMAKANLFVLSSRHEALPTVLIEALACGCPVVSTDCPFGPREILEDGRYGALIPVGDAEALAGAMFRALSEPPRSCVLKERAAFFSADRAIDRYEELLFRDG